LEDKACRRAPDEHWIGDGVNPTCAGHRVMVGAWERDVRAFWPEKNR
jgi:hypothetical protein